MFYNSYYNNRRRIYQEDKMEVMNLMAMTKPGGYCHFVYLTNLSNLFHKALTQSNLTHTVCPRTLYYDNSKVYKDREEWLRNHDCREQCKKLKPVKHREENEETKQAKPLCFHRMNYLLDIPVFIVFNFEATLRRPTNVEDDQTLQEHCINSWCYSIHSPYDLNLPRNSTQMYVTTNIEESEASIISKFLMNLQKDTMYIQNRLRILREEYREHTYTEYFAHREEFENAMECTYCCMGFTEENPKVFHHDHYNGKYIGACCNECNLQVQCLAGDIPIFAHNMKNYDGQLIMKNFRFDSWLEVIQEDVIYFMWDAEEQRVYLERNRYNILRNILTNPSYHYVKGDIQSEEGFKVFLLYQEGEQPFVEFFEEQTIDGEYINKFWIISNNHNLQMEVRAEILNLTSCQS